MNRIFNMDRSKEKFIYFKNLILIKSIRRKSIISRKQLFSKNQSETSAIVTRSMCTQCVAFGRFSGKNTFVRMSRVREKPEDLYLL